MNSATVTGIGLIAAVIAGFLFPQGSAGKPVIPFVLGAMLYFNFLALTLELKSFVRYELAAFPVIVWGILPPLALLAGRMLPGEIATGFFLAVITPPAVSGVVMASLMGGEKELPVVNAVIYNLLSPIAYTVLTGVWLSAAAVAVPVKAILTEVGSVVIIPFVISIIVRRLPAVDRISKNIAPFYNPLAMIFIVYTSIAVASPRFRALPLLTALGIFGFVFCVASVLYAAGFIIGKDPSHRRSLAVSLGQKNVGLGMLVALNNFSPLAAVPVVLYLISHHIINSVLIITRGTVAKK
ncbi:MAG: bile acid:sodium symporter [Spirochaetes bacterium]|nr:bile acid:sodium symporter [Spirochaetota bacterium]